MNTKPIVEKLDKVAQSVEAAGLKDVAFKIDQISDQLEGKTAAEAKEVYAYDKEASEAVLSTVSEDVKGLVSSEIEMIKTALEEIDMSDRDIEAAERTIEAAKKKKKKWIQGIGLKKGRLTKYKEPGESMEEAAKRALKSSDPSVRGMGAFFMSTRGFKKGKKE